MSVSVTIQSTNKIPELIEQLKKLGGREIQVGVFGKDGKDGEANIATLARVHEYGMTITPKRGKFLAIPANKAAVGKSPRDFGESLKFHSTHGGAGGVLVREGKAKAHGEVMFILVRRIKIPERSFLRTGFDKNVDAITKVIEQYADQVLQFKINPDIFLDMVGLKFAGMIQTHAIRDVKSPANAQITIDNKRSENPLVNTGRMIGAIRHEVK